MPRRRRGNRANAGSGNRQISGAARAAANSASQLVPRPLVPPRDPPTVRQNPRRQFRLYVNVEVTSGLNSLSTGDVWTVLKSWTSGTWMQIHSVQLWGASGLGAGTAQTTRLHLVDALTGVDVDDRSGLSSDRPRCGLQWPPAARKVWKSTDDTVFVTFTTVSGTDTSSEFQCLVHVTVW